MLLFTYFFFLFMIWEDCYSGLKIFIFLIDAIYFWFLSSQKNLYMIHHNSDLFYDMSNTITEHNQRQTNYLLSILNYFGYLFLSKSKISFITSSALSLIMICMLSLFQSIPHSFSFYIEEIKLFAVVNWIFHISYFFRLFMMFFKCGLILFGYSSTYFFKFFNWLICLSSITITFIFNIIFTPKIVYSYWFIITFLFFFMFFF